MNNTLSSCCCVSGDRIRISTNVQNMLMYKLPWHSKSETKQEMIYISETWNSIVCNSTSHTLKPFYACIASAEVGLWTSFDWDTCIWTEGYVPNILLFKLMYGAPYYTLSENVHESAIQYVSLVRGSVSQRPFVRMSFKTRRWNKTWNSYVSFLGKENKTVDMIIILSKIPKYGESGHFVFGTGCCNCVELCRNHFFRWIWIFLYILSRNMSQLPDKGNFAVSCDHPMLTQLEQNHSPQT